MVIYNKQYHRRITTKEIFELLSDIDYFGYIPYSFIVDLHKIWSNLIMDGDITRAFPSCMSTDYDAALYKLIEYVQKAVNYTFDSKLFIQKTILLLKDKVDFRKIERAKNSGTWFELEPNATNYLIEIKDIPDRICTILNIPKQDKDYRLTPEIERLLYNFNIIDRLPGTFEYEFSYTRQKLTKYSQITKVLKHRLSFPTFEIDYILKSLPIKYPGIHKDKSADIILMIDVSESTYGDSDYTNLMKSVLLYYINIYNTSMKIKVITYSHYVCDIIEINSLNDLNKIFLTEFQYVPQNKGWQGAFDYIESTYNNKNIVCINDGIANISFMHPKNKWFIVSSLYNKTLDNLAKISDAYYTIHKIK